MVVERDDDPGAEDSDKRADMASNLTQRREVLDYVADIARELSGLVDRHGIRALGDDLRAIAVKALKAKYQDIDDPQMPKTPPKTPPEDETRG